MTININMKHGRKQLDRDTSDIFYASRLLTYFEHNNMDKLEYPLMKGVVKIYKQSNSEYNVYYYRYSFLKRLINTLKGGY